MPLPADSPAPHPPPLDHDVRMRGFLARYTVAAAWNWVDAQPGGRRTESVALDRAPDRVLAETVMAPRDVPAFERAAMDGYALRGSETTGAREYAPLTLRVIGQALPGQPFAGTVGPGEAVRIMTGAPLPSGADAILPAEFAQASGEFVEVLASVPAGKHVGCRGEDVACGQAVLSQGRRLRPQDVALLAALGWDAVTVLRRPRVRIITTGQELVPPGTPCGPHQIYDANSSMLHGLVVRDGGEVEQLLRLPDDRALLRAALMAPQADVILVSGGSSVGSEDHAPTLLAELGHLAIHGVAMRPSSPAGMGTVGGTLVFLLPGNPVSCLCAYDFFAGRALRRLGGRTPAWPYRSVELPLVRKLSSVVGRVDYARVRLVAEADGRPVGVEPLALSGAAILSSTVRADGFVVVPQDCEGYPPQALVQVFLYDPL